MTILLVLESQGAKLPKGTLAAITAAREIKSLHGGSKLVALIFGDSAKAEAARYGFDQLIVASGAQLEHYLARSYANVVTAVARDCGASTVVGLASSRGKDLFPRVAAALGAGQASDVLAVLPEHRFRRAMFAGNILAEVEVVSPIRVVTVRGTAFEPAAPTAETTVIQEFTGNFESGGMEFRAFETVQSERPELTEAEIVVSGGRALKSAENFTAVVLPLADSLKAAVGASRAAVDSGYAPNDWQVGQTGKVVAPKLYIAVGISGAIQHLAGMKDSKVIVAINKDPEAPIFEVADYGLVADLFEVVPELTSALKGRG